MFQRLVRASFGSRRKTIWNNLLAGGFAEGDRGGGLRAALAVVTAIVRSEKLGEGAHEFDAVHTIERAQRVGSVDRIVALHDRRLDPVAVGQEG